MLSAASRAAVVNSVRAAASTRSAVSLAEGAPALVPSTPKFSASRAARRCEAAAAEAIERQRVVRVDRRVTRFRSVVSSTSERPSFQNQPSPSQLPVPDHQNTAHTKPSLSLTTRLPPSALSSPTQHISSSSALYLITTHYTACPTRPKPSRIDNQTSHTKKTARRPRASYLYTDPAIARTIPRIPLVPSLLTRRVHRRLRPWCRRRRHPRRCWWRCGGRRDVLDCILLDMAGRRLERVLEGALTCKSTQWRTRERAARRKIGASRRVGGRSAVTQ